MVNVMLQSADRCKAEAPRRSKSFEEREEEYEKARRRIFHQEQVRSPIKEYHTPSTYLAISTFTQDQGFHPPKVDGPFLAKILWIFCQGGCSHFNGILLHQKGGMG